MRRKTQATQTVVDREVLPHLDALHRYCLYLSKDRTEAEDLTQETLVKSIKSISSFKEGTNCKAWLFRIATNTFLNKVRRKPIQLEYRDAYPADPGVGRTASSFVRANRTPEESFVTQLSRSKVRDAIEALPSEFRPVVVLADLEGFAYREIAEILSCPIGTVMSRLHRGRRLLRTKLADWARELGLIPAEDEEQSGAVEGEDSNVTPLSLYRNRNQGE
jgi:RNA polymerase sigma-70 factor, ECF subfamily